MYLVSPPQPTSADAYDFGLSAVSATSSRELGSS